MTDIPRLGLGTYGRTGREGRALLAAAIELGYRHFDTAQTYGTEAVIAGAIADSGLPRDAFFLTTKIADTNLSRPDFDTSLRVSLDRLRVARVDLLLVHWPSVRDAVPFEEYLGALVAARAQGLTARIGLSNFPVALVDRAVAIAGAGEIATNQVECHPFLQNRRLRAGCARHGIPVTAYMPLAGGLVMHDVLLRQIGARYATSPATVTLAWLLGRGLIVIPASTNRAHLASNLAALDLVLEPAEMAAIDALDRRQRLIDPAKSPAWD